MGRRTASILALGLMLGCAGSAQAAGPPPPHVPVPAYGTGMATGVQTELSDPTGMPPGVVNGPCTPGPAHPYPVVLVHGTGANANLSWQTLAPMLSDAGYCVFALNYGAQSWTGYSGDHTYALDSIEHSAGQLANFIQNIVLPDTGASAVDIVGHSQGGMMPRYYIEHGWNCAASALTTNGYGETQCAEQDSGGVAGTSDVHELIGLAPSNHGADAQGLVPIFEKLFGSYTWSFPNQGCGACGEQEAGNPFMDALNAHEPDAGSSILYYVFETADDEVVSPAPNAVDEALGEWPSAFLHGSPDQVLNVRLQDQCANDATDHIGIIYDPVAIQDITAALADNGGPGSAPLAVPAPTCPTTPVPPLFSG